MENNTNVQGVRAHTVELSLRFSSVTDVAVEVMRNSYIVSSERKKHSKPNFSKKFA